MGRLGGSPGAAPTRGFAAIAQCIAFYAAPMDACSVDGERCYQNRVA